MMSSVVDTRSIGKPKDFSGEPKDWPGWEFAFLSYLNLVSPRMATLCQEAQALPNLLTFEDMDQEVEGMAQQLFHILVMMCQRGKPVAILMQAERGNGFAAFLSLKAEMEPRIGGRHATMLASLITPNWSGTDLERWRSAFMEWEISIGRYEMQSKEIVSDSLRIAVVSKYAPAEVRLAIRSSQRFIGDEYQKLKSVVLDYVIGGREFAAEDMRFGGQGGNDNMEIDWIKGKKGKGKGKQDKGKSSWNSEHKGKGKGKSKDKGKGKHGKATPKAAATSAFQGECSHCGKWGHKKADCWKPGGGSVNALDYESGAPSSASTLRISEL